MNLASLISHSDLNPLPTFKSRSTQTCSYFTSIPMTVTSYIRTPQPPLPSILTLLEGVDSVIMAERPSVQTRLPGNAAPGAAGRGPSPVLPSIRDLQSIHGPPRLDAFVPQEYRAGAVSPTRYCCRLCRDNPHVYGSTGTFKRHVTHEHRAEFRYRCFHNGCRFDTPRRDKLGSHLQRQHRIFPTRNFLDGLRNLCPSPGSCAICHDPVSNWKAWFECVARHCRLPSGGSPATSTSQSRRDNGNSGGDGSNFSENQPFGNGGSIPFH